MYLTQERYTPHTDTHHIHRYTQTLTDAQEYTHRQTTHTHTCTHRCTGTHTHRHTHHTDTPHIHRYNDTETDRYT